VHVGLEFLEADQVAGVEVVPGTFQREAFQSFADLINVDNVGGSQLADQGGLIGTEDEISAFRSAANGFPQRGASDAPFPCELDFPQGGSFRTFPRKDRIAKSLKSDFS